MSMLVVAALEVDSTSWRGEP